MSERGQERLLLPVPPGKGRGPAAITAGRAANGARDATHSLVGTKPGLGTSAEPSSSRSRDEPKRALWGGF